VSCRLEAGGGRGVVGRERREVVRGRERGGRRNRLLGMIYGL